ncbi:MAG: CbiX/SirB N-terminal domain-containing protein [Planctomycetaceae bacterium]
MSIPVQSPNTAILLVDHGSRRAESNALLHDAAKRFRQQSNYQIVEPAHMELAQPSIQQAFDRCVERGAQRIVVFPWFLSPGRHWTEDIPQLVRIAATQHPGVTWIVTPPFGLHPGLFSAVADRIDVSVRKWESESVG